MALNKWLLTLTLFVAATAASASERPYDEHLKVRADNLIVSATSGKDTAGRSMVGWHFDVVGTIVIYTDPKLEPVTFVGSNPDFPAVLKLNKLSMAQQEKLFDVCSPTPCIARLLVTVLEPFPGRAVLQVDDIR